MPPPRCTTPSGPHVDITFVNDTHRDVDLLWVDASCDEKQYATLPGSPSKESSVTEHTYVGHVWRARDAATHEMLRDYAAFDASPRNVSIAGSPAQTTQGPVVENEADREVSEIDLVDWEGRVANAAPKFLVRPAKGTNLPAQLTLSTDSPCVYFDLPSSVTGDGSRKDLDMATTAASPGFRISVFGDDRGADETHSLLIQTTDGAGVKSCVRIPVRVRAEGRSPLASATPPFAVHIDFSQDTTGFFDDAEKRAIVQRAADDWAYFIDDMGLDVVPPRVEKTWVWDATGLVTGHSLTNPERYKGYFLYAEGIPTTALRSGGAGSYEGGVQSSHGAPLPFRRSGQLTIDTQGNFNTLGWLVSDDLETWWKATNAPSVPNDLYSIAHHEIGHALFFDDAHPADAKAKANGAIHSDELFAYLGKDLAMNTANHFSATIDPVSGVGAFGNEYNGVMPALRWQITKTDLLALEAMGYKLRKIGPLK